MFHTALAEQTDVSRRETRKSVLCIVSYCLMRSAYDYCVKQYLHCLSASVTNISLCLISLLSGKVFLLPNLVCVVEFRRVLYLVGRFKYKIFFM